MESLKVTLFEDPVRAYVVLAVAEAMLLLAWRATRTRRSLLCLLIPPVLAAGAFALAALVVTDRERIEAALGEIAAAVEAGDVGAVAGHVDEEYSGYCGSREALLEMARRTHGAMGLRKVRILDSRIDVEGAGARMSVQTAVTYDGGAFGPGGLGITWRVRWARRADGWKVVHAAEPSFGPSGGRP